MIAKSYKTPHRIVNFIRDKQTNLSTVYGIAGYILTIGLGWLNAPQIIYLLIWLIIDVMLILYSYKGYVIIKKKGW